jgi:phosphoserine phosphatase
MKHRGNGEKPYDAFIADLDGTLIAGFSLFDVARYGAEIGLFSRNFPYALERLEKLYRQHTMNYERFAERAIKESLHAFTGKKVSEIYDVTTKAIRQGRIQPRPGAIGLMKLAKRYADNICLLTATPRAIADSVVKNIFPTIGDVIATEFSVIGSGDDARYGAKITRFLDEKAKSREYSEYVRRKSRNGNPVVIACGDSSHDVFVFSANRRIIVPASCDMESAALRTNSLVWDDGNDGFLSAAERFLDSVPTNHQQFYDRLSPDEKLLLVLRDILYSGSWESMKRDLNNRREGRPYIFNISTPTNYDTLVERMRVYEEENRVNLSAYVTVSESKTYG